MKIKRDICLEKFRRLNCTTDMNRTPPFRNPLRHTLAENSIGLTELASGEAIQSRFGTEFAIGRRFHIGKRIFMLRRWLKNGIGL